MEQKEQQLPLETSAQPIAQPQKEQPKADAVPATVAKKEKYTPELCASTISKLPAQLQALKDCFAIPFDAFRKAFKNPAEADRVMAKEIDFAAQAMMANPYLIQCATSNPMDLVNALKNVALTGSTLNPVLKQGYLVPFKGKVQFMPSYMGLVDVLMNNGLVKKIEAHCVFEGDDFKVMYGTGGGLSHKPDVWGKHTPETLKGVYYYAVLADGAEMFDTMSKDEVETIKQRSPSVAKGKPSPWDTDYLEMAKKGLALDTLIPTPDGFTTMGEIKVGDKLFNALGEVTTVTSKSEVKQLPCYRVTFQNGDSFVCDHEHRWFVSGTSYRKQGWFVGDTKTLAAVKEMGYPIVAPKIKATRLPEQELPINPYVLGYWLGNGNKYSAVVTCDKKDVEEIASYFSPYYDVSIKYETKNNSAQIRPTSKGVRNPKTSLMCQLAELKENEGKYIPRKYMRASIAQRIELIQGLCDSDGCCHGGTGRCSFGSVKELITRDVAEILCSIGERVVVTSRLAKGFGKEVMYYEVQWRPQINPFKLKRKASKVRPRKLDVRHSIKSIEEVESVPTQCIAVDSFGATEENDLRKSFAIGRGFYITHNTIVRRAFKLIPKNGISESKVKALEAVFDYDEKAEQSWIKEQQAKPKADSWDEEEADYEEVK